MQIDTYDSTGVKIQTVNSSLMDINDNIFWATDTLTEYNKDGFDKTITLYGGTYKRPDIAKTNSKIKVNCPDGTTKIYSYDEKGKYSKTEIQKADISGKNYTEFCNYAKHFGIGNLSETRFEELKSLAQKMYNSLVDSTESNNKIQSPGKENAFVFNMVYSYLYNNCSIYDTLDNSELSPCKKLDKLLEINSFCPCYAVIGELCSNMIEDKNAVEFFNHFADIVSKYDKNSSEYRELINVISSKLGVDGNKSLDELLSQSKNTELKNAIDDIYKKMLNYSDKWEKTSKVETHLDGIDYLGEEYNVSQNGKIITVTDKNGKKKDLNLEKLSENTTGLRKIQLKQTIQNLPGEVLWDMAVELSKSKITNDKEDAPEESAGYYRPWNDSVNINDWATQTTLVHELGHAIDCYPQGSIIKKTIRVLLQTIQLL